MKTSYFLLTMVSLTLFGQPPTKRTAVEPTRPQNSRSDLLISTSLTGSETNKGALDHSNSELPLWPVWTNVGLFVVLCIACITNKPKDE